MKTLAFFVIIVTTFTVSCKKTSVRNSDFCTPIANKQFNEVGSLINGFLHSQNNNLSTDIKLNELVAWLKKFDCVKNVNLLCNSCIKTLPAQSELEVMFLVNGQQVRKIVDISMSNQLRFVTFHD